MKNIGGPGRVARALLDGGPTTAADLAERLDLSGTVIRRHLDSLVDRGLVEASEKPPFGPMPERGRGRPARFYCLTASGREMFDAVGDELAVAALRYVAEMGGSDAVLDFARGRLADLELRYSASIARSDCSDVDSKSAMLAEALSADGFSATAVSASSGAVVQLCQNHCPVGHVASEFPQFCEAESEAFERILGAHVTRLATIANGDGVCTTLVSVPAISRSRLTQGGRQHDRSHSS